MKSIIFALLLFPSLVFGAAGDIPIEQTGGTITTQTVSGDGSLAEDGTLTVSIATLDATTESAVEAAIDALLNLVSVQGETLSFSDVGADAFWGFDDTDDEYAPLTAAEAFAIIAGVSGTVTGDWEFDGDFNVGDPGTESGSMQLGGVATNVLAQINNFGATYDAELWLHRHSSTEGPDIVFTRSDSDTSAHGDVSDTNVLGTFTWAGWNTASYYAAASLLAAVDGTPGVADMPAQLKFLVSPDGSATPALALALRADKTAEFYGAMQLGGQLDVNGNALGDGTLELLTFVEDASAINNIEIENEATGSGPIIRATGDDTDVNLMVETKGAGYIDLDANIIAGDPGFEADGITIAGGTYQAELKVSDIGGTNAAQMILHRHSTTLPPSIVSGRSNSDDSTHATVTTGQELFSVIGAGWDSADYAMGGRIDIEVDGTAGAGDMPGRMVFSVSADGAEIPGEAMRISNDKSLTLAGYGSGSITGTDAYWLAVDASGNVIEEAAPTTGINIVFDGGGSAIQDAEMICAEIPFAATITEARLIADQSGSIVVDWWLDSYANYPPTNADSICDAGTCPTLSTAQKYSDSTLTSWTTSISAEDVICAYVDGAATSITRATAVLKLIR